jgi:hypothetical protein
MSLILFLKNKPILHIRSGTFQSLYDQILEIIEIEEIKLSESLQWLIDKLYGATGGASLDFSNYLKTKDDADFFAELIKQGIEKMVKVFPNLTEESKKRLWNFYSELYNYAQSLK